MEMRARLSADELQALRCVSGEDPVSAANLCLGLRIRDQLQRTKGISRAAWTMAMAQL